MKWFVQATANSIAAAIDRHIRTYGGAYSAWYVGVACDPNDRLLNGHNANGQSNAARYWDAGSEETARSIERFFIKKGCQGGAGGGDSNTKYVYVYKVSSSTME